MGAIVNEFLIESRENLDRLETDLVELEKEPSSQSVLASIFRTIHTVKGTSGFLALRRLETLAHAGEGLLSRMREGHIRLDPAITAVLLATVDRFRAILTNLESTGREGDGQDRDLLQAISRHLPPEQAGGGPVRQGFADTSANSANEAESASGDSTKSLGQLLVENVGVDPAVIQAALETQQQGDTRRLGEILVERGMVSPSVMRNVVEFQRETRAPSISGSSIRVDVATLDGLMNRIGELVLARNQIVEYPNPEHNEVIASASQRLNLITTELQALAMKARMQSVGSVWMRLPRLARDLAAAQGKQIRLVMDGNDTELDKTLLEAIKDPLTHLVRNSVDHGIEIPEQRQAAGKPREGCITLRAFHAGGQVTLEISDDGAGIDVERVREKALAMGLVTADQAAVMDDQQTTNLVFCPGFTTADKVSILSGRGVGMDIVRSNIEKIGGSVDLQTRPGQGTTVRIVIPLTLAILPALLVATGDERLAVPQAHVLEVVRLDLAEAPWRIESVQGAPVYRLRGTLLPLLHLGQAFGWAPSPQAAKLCSDGAMSEGPPGINAAAASAMNIVVLRANGQKFGILVDGVVDTSEIVVKPLDTRLKGVTALAGATILRDGRVALILDVLGLAQHLHLTGEDRHTHSKVERFASANSEGQVPLHKVLLVQNGERERMAIELSEVVRIEQFSYSDVEVVGDSEVVQYHGTVIPLVWVTELLGRARLPTTTAAGPLQVVICRNDGAYIGLVVDRILDIVEAPSEIQLSIRRTGVHGTTVVQSHSTEVLDVEGMAEKAAIRPKEVSRTS